ncbi:CusA/CzcA family heavy metal efflux RND transporter [Rapidithrix thailandica]|uniref:CusA/CzcA family heavy metal efflux RND transporter n=1 Tax=Rapidithrix thailandica TaxID=413964 RepID=A0AAW9S501_9BACT
MIDRIIHYSIKNKLITGLMTLALIVGGVYSMTKVPLDAVPDITNNQVQVITTAPNLSTEDIEQFVTYTVELSMANLPGVVEIRSISRFGLSVVTIVFEDDMGTYLPRQLVNEKLTEIKDEIPKGFGEPFMGPISTGLGEIYQYTIEPQSGYDSTYSATELRTIQDWIVKRQMAMVPGVVEVNSFGGNIKQYEVAINPNKLKSLGITTREIFSALEENNQNTGGAYIEKNHKANFIRGEGLARNLKDIENIVIQTVNDIPILVKDVAEVQYGSAIRYGAFTKNGKGEAIGGTIMMLKGANSNEVIANVKERVSLIQKSLPEGLQIKPFLDRSTLIKSTTGTVTQNLLEGGLIVIFILVFLLGNFRGGLIVASTIPLSLLFAFVLMHQLDVWANLMSLGAIDFGIIVDGAVIIVESTVFYLTQKVNSQSSVKLSQKERDKMTAQSASKMMNSAFFGQLIILIVFLPILALTGVEGKMFKPMALTFGFAMLGAMLLCLTYVPMMSALLLNVKKEQKITWGDKLVLRLKRLYEPMLLWALRKKAIILGVSLLLLFSAGWIFHRMGGEFIPQLDEGDIAFHAIAKPGSSLSEAIQTTTKIEKLLLNKFPEIDQIVSRIGVSEVPTDPMPMDIADVIATLKPQEEWVTTNDKEELIRMMKETVSNIPGVNYEFTQPIEMRFNELLTGVREDVAIKLYGEDLSILAQKAEEIGKIISGIQGVADMNVEATSGLPQMTVEYERGKLAQYGLTISDLNTIVSMAFSGGKAGVIFEGEKRFDLVVRLDKSQRSDIDDLKNLFVNLPNGEQIPLKEVAHISYQPGPMQISRENTTRRTYVGINVRGRDVQSLVKEIQQKLDAQLQLPAGYFIRYGGAFENFERAQKRLILVVPMALALIFVLLYFALNSFRQTLMIYMAIPLAAIGGIFSLWLRDMPFSISAGVGFIVLFGVAVLNGLVLISSLNELKERGVNDLFQRIIQGTSSRVRPILLTASTDILGFLPMAISTSAGAEVQRPLATVVIGGLLTSTLLTLFVLPIVYHWLENRKTKTSSMVTAKWLLPGFLLLGLGSIDNPLAAQEAVTIPLVEAQELARKNYPAVQSAQLAIEKQQALSKTSWDLGQTQVFTGGEEKGNGEGGVTTLIGISQQNIDIFGGFSKSRLNKEQVTLAHSQKQLTERQVVQYTTQAYYTASYAKSRRALTLRLDSIYQNFKNAAEVRYQTEETSQIEYLIALSKYQKVKVLAQQAHDDYKIALKALNQWLMQEGSFDVYSQEELLEVRPPSSLPKSPENSPLLQPLQQQLKVSEQMVRVQKAQLLPKLSLQYGQQKIGGQTGFYSYQIGLSIPLWFSPQQGIIQAARIEQRRMEQELALRKTELNASYQQTQKEIEKTARTLDYYQQQVLPLAEQQIEAADKGYRFGELDYVAYIQTLDQAVNTKLEFLEYLLEYHQKINRLNFIVRE